MIRISIPAIKNEGGRTYMVAHIIDEKQGVNEDIWFSTPEEYGKYFTPELSDAFLVGALMPAVRQQEDIVVEGTVTESLYHNITETIAPLIQNSFDVTAKTDGSKLSWGGYMLKYQ